MGNLLAGVLALSYLQDAAALEGEAQAGLWNKAAWLIFLGMICDALDGRVARLTKSTSAFGAQIDSLADVVTFGVVPAMLAKSLLTATFPMIAPRVLLALGLVYVVGAALRLARYNVESTRIDPAGANHVTMVFRGLPSPAAAGVVASLVLLRYEYQLLSLDWAVLVAPPLLGLLMTSRLPYPHLLNRFLDGRRPMSTVMFLVVTVFLAVMHLLETVAAVFVLYALSGMLLYVVARATGYPRWALREETDEVDGEDIEGEEGDEDDDEDEDEEADESPPRTGADRSGTTG
jgi:CDP-diacylglycerol--serine O-phosphatidyltransferase